MQRPVVTLDEDEQGGFSVQGELHEAQIPDGWTEDREGHFAPPWTPCRYRRLNVQTKDGVVQIESHCLLFSEVVPKEICTACELVEPPFQTITKEELEASIPEGMQIPIQPTEEIARFLEILPKAIQLDNWPACQHRESVKLPESCCTKYFCRCDGCPLKGKKLRLKDCQNCEYRQLPPLPPIGTPPPPPPEPPEHS